METGRYECLGDLTGDTLDYFKSRHIIRIDEFMPYYMASMGCHVLNLYNRTKRTIYTRTGTVPDLRLNMFFVGPPGFSKSFFCDILFDETFGVASKFPNREVAYLTLPGLIGTVSGKDEAGEPIIEHGVAETHKQSIIWCEEFTSISEVMKTEHSAGMSGLLLMLTDNGKVSRDMRFGTLSYQSYSTILLGTQTERLDLVSGLSRRFLFLDLNPSNSDIAAYNAAWEVGEEVKPDFIKIEKLREGYLMLNSAPPNLNKIVLTDEYLKFRRSMPAIHIDKDSLNRFAIGWNFMNNFHWRNTELLVEAPTEMQRHMLHALEMKYSILGELNFLALEKMLSHGDWVEETEFKWKLVQLGMGYRTGSERIDQMVGLGLLQRKFEKGVRGRPKRWIKYARKKDTDEKDTEFILTPQKTSPPVRP